MDDKNIANEFNKYFSEIGKELAGFFPHNDIDPLNCVTPVSNSFTFKTISKSRRLQYESKQIAGTDKFQ